MPRKRYGAWYKNKSQRKQYYSNWKSGAKKTHTIALEALKIAKMVQNLVNVEFKNHDLVVIGFVIDNAGVSLLLNVIL